MTKWPATSASSASSKWKRYEWYEIVKNFLGIYDFYRLDYTNGITVVLLCDTCRSFCHWLAAKATKEDHSR
jgi:hypothetical protein